MNESAAVDIRSDEAEWLAALHASGPEQGAAVDRLRDFLLRAVLVYLTRHRSDLAGMDYDELQHLAEDWTQQALLQVLDKLDTFRGDSKFTTWAYRVATNLAAGELRRKHWENLSLEQLTESDSPDIRLREDLSAPMPETQVTRSQVWQAVRSVIKDDLTDRQRTVLIQIVFNGMPVEVVAEQLGTNRNNVYKILHDARRKLKRELEERDWREEDVLAAFASSGGD
jgi:RNA polymerase sigma-70 factor, ECF subfamily